jgi:hypothetical protein
MTIQLCRYLKMPMHLFICISLSQTISSILSLGDLFRIRYAWLFHVHISRIERNNEDANLAMGVKGVKKSERSKKRDCPTCFTPILLLRNHIVAGGKNFTPLTVNLPIRSKILLLQSDRLSPGVKNFTLFFIPTSDDQVSDFSFKFLKTH